MKHLISKLTLKKPAEGLKYRPNNTIAGACPRVYGLLKDCVSNFHDPADLKFMFFYS